MCSTSLKHAAAGTGGSSTGVDWVDDAGRRPLKSRRPPWREDAVFKRLAAELDAVRAIDHHTLDDVQPA